MITYDIKTIVPAFIRNDHNGNAMMKAIDRCLKIFCDVCLEGIECVTDIDKMPEWRLNEYAWEMGAEWFDSTATIDEKRDQAKAIHEVYRKIGTNKALVDAVSALFGSVSIVDEWFEYGGEPYHYKIKVSKDDAYIARRDECIRLVNIIASVRSVLDVLQYFGTGRTDAVYVASEAVGIYGSSVGVANI